MQCATNADTLSSYIGILPSKEKEKLSCIYILMKAAISSYPFVTVSSKKVATFWKFCHGNIKALKSCIGILSLKGKENTVLQFVIS